MVFHSLHAPRSGVYVQQLLCELREDLDLGAFERAWQRLVARHAVLRTCFHWAAGDQPLQVVRRHVDLPVARHDWRGMSPRRRARELEAFLQADRVRGFELTEAPLVRLALFRLGEANYRLVWTSHHALLDGRARLVLLQELFACYEADLQGRGPELGPLRPFRDWVEWLEQRDLGPAEGYWRRALAGFTAPTPLAATRASVGDSEEGPGRQSLRLSRRLTSALHALATRHDLTPNTLLQGAWALLLSRYSGEGDVLFGATRACRRMSLEGVESIVGLLINTVPVRVRVPPDTRLLPWLRELRAAWVTMREYEHTPLTVVQRCSELPSGEPLFESLVVFESRPLESTLRAQGGAWRRRAFRLRGSTNYPLTVTGYQEPRLRIEITYERGRFAGGAIARMLEHLRTLLEGMVARPDARLAELPLLTGAERRRVLVELNRTPASSAEPACLHAIVEAQTDRTPGAAAVVWGTARLTYDELDRRANRLAHHLRALGVGPEVRVGLCLERSPDLVVSLLGILKAGGAYVPLDPGYPEARLRLMLEDAGIAVVVTRRRLLASLPPSVAATIVCLDHDGEAIAARSEARPAGGATADHLAYVLYTSGSTGRPKGVAIAHQSPAALLAWTRGLYSPDELAGVLAATSISFDLSVFELFAPLSRGGAVILAENVLELPTLPAAEQVTLVNTVPSAMSTLLQVGGLPASVRTVNLAGEALHQTLVRELGTLWADARVYNLYGPTEDTTYSTCALVTPDAVEPPAIGRPIPGTRCYVLDQRLEPLPVGVPGELYLAGLGLARGYVGRPALTAGRFLPDPFGDEPGARMYRTGDRVRWRPDGTLEFLGRVDQQVKIRGHRVEPGEVDAVLRTHPAVRDCAVVARGEGGQASLVAYVVPAGGKAPRAADLRRYLKQRLPPYLLPAAFVRLDVLPLTPNGKLDRRSLPAPSERGTEAASAAAAPRTPVEEILARIWAEVLGLDRVGIHDDFFELGGHSLVATRIAARVRAAFTLDLPVRALFRARTVAELAGLIDGAEPAAARTAPDVPREGPRAGLPLSFAQERLWFLDQLEPGSSFYNTPIALRLKGPLDVAALEHALAAVVARHDVLRTTFPAPEGVPLAVVAPAVEHPLPVTDLTARPSSEREPDAHRLATEEAREPFDLARGPLLRTRLYRLDRHEHLLLLVMHHIVTDGWSAGVLFSELGAIYRAVTAGESLVLDRLPMQYGEYAAWQREWLRDEVLAPQLGYWKARLETAPAVLELPTDRPRPVKQAFKGARRSRPLPASLAARLGLLSQREGVTPFMTFLAAFQTLLLRYTGQEDLVVGVPVANRPRVEAEGMIGLFVNTLALRTDLSGNPPFRDLLARVRETALEAYTHQDLPFQRLVEELARGRDPTRTPLVQVLFQLVRIPPLDLPGVNATPVEIDRGAAKFDLTLSMQETAAGVHACLEYDTALFDGATIERMLGHFQALLEGVVADPARRLSELPILGAEERSRLLTPPHAAAGSAPHGCIHQLFEAQADRSPDATAVVFEGRRLTYRALNADANRLAHALRRRGVGPEVRVGICCRRSPDMIVGLLGVLKAGGVYVPLDPASPRERLALILEEASPPVLLTQTDLAERFSGLRGEVIRLDADRHLLASESAANPDGAATEACAAYVIYTSGSTGRPKGVVVEHRTVVNYIWGIGRRLEIGAGATFAMVQPLTVDSSVTVLFPSLCTGGCLHLVSEDRAADAAALRDYFRRYPIDYLKIAPSHLAALQAAPEPERLLPRRCLVLGGEASHWTWVKELQTLAPDCRIINHYGPTEATVGVLTYLAPGEENGHRSPLLPMGRPLPNVRAYLLDRYLNPVPLGIPGDLYLAGDCLARGYLDRPGLTAEKFIPNPFDATPGTRLYRTGDLARYLPDGELEFLGRRDQQVKIRGFRIEPGEIESALRTHPAVREAVVVAREPDGADSRMLVAYLACRPPAPAARDLAGFLRGKLPEYMIPAAFSVLDALPRTPQGKLDRKALPAPDRFRPGVEADLTEARTPVEDLLAGIWAEVLRLERVGPDQNFFELGGHSLLATRVVARVRTVLGAEIPVRALFEAPTVALLARRIEAALRTTPLAPDLPITRAPRTGPLPLSYGQQRLWFFNQFDPRSPVHNAPLSVRLTGELDPVALGQALDAVVARHEALRTTFSIVQGTPVQVVGEAGAVPLPLTDLSRLPPDGRPDEAERLLVEEAMRPFDVETGPLLRARLLRLDATEHLLMLSIHHIVSDASSGSILLHELSALYEACAAGRPSPLPELAVQYPDFAVWQRECLEGPALEHQLEYWRERLAGAPPVLHLPTDRPRPPVQSFRGARESLTLTRELSDGIAALSRRESVTLFMTVTAAFQTLLARYTGQDDLVVGAPIAGRNRQETEGLIGLFLNTLVLRTDLSGDPSFRELLARVRDVALGAYTHADLPFERLVEALAPERDPSRNPIFQVLVNRLPPPAPPIESAGLTMERIRPPSVGSRFDLTLYMRERQECVELHLGYGADLFDADTVARMLQQLRVLLESAVADPSRRLSELPLLPAAERQLLAEWNATDADTSGAESAHRMFEAQAARTPEAEAVRVGDQHLTYRELDTRAGRLARHLRRRGVGPDTLVAICVERSLDLPIGVLGILKAGGAYVPFDPAHPKARFGLILEETRPRLLLTQARLAPTLPPFGGEVLHLDALPEAGGGGSSIVEELPAGPEHLAYVMYTSGSTGRPKGVLVRHRGVVNYLTWLNRTYALGPADVVLQVPSFSYTASVRDLIGPLTAGARVVMVDELDARSPDALLAEIRSRRVTCLLAVVPTLLDGLIETARARGIVCESLRLIVASGEVLRSRTARDAREVLAPHALVVNQYGPTECTMNATCCDGDPRQVDDGLVSIGRPVANYRISILDRRLGLAPIGVPGELYIGGVGLARGYHDRPGLTAERFVPDPFGTEPGSRLYRTGDRARWRSDGNLEFLGRVDHQVKLRGHRVELGEIEAALGEHPAVRAAAVVLREDRPGDPQLVAYAAAARNGDGLERELRELLKEKLPAFMVPARFVLLETLPLTPTGKVDRRALPPPGARQPPTPSEAPDPALTPVERVVASVMGEVLGLKRLGPGDNFFELGGHSLLGTQLLSRVRDALRVELPLRTLFRTPTVAGLAAAAEAARQEGLPVEAPPPRPVLRDGPLPLSFAQQRLWFLDRLEPGCVAYNIPAAVRLTGPLDPSGLERSLNRVVRRHEALRTRFVMVDGSPAQIVAPDLALAMPVADLRYLEGVEQEAEVRRLASEEAERPFDLARLPLVRATLLRLAEEHHVLLLTIHHIVADGWSLGVLFRELSSFYEADLERKPAVLPELAIQYPDYAEWQRGGMRGAALDEQLSYWKRQLGGRLPVLALPTDRPRPQVRTFGGGRCTAVIPARVREALETFGRKDEASLYMVLLAAFKTLLSRYTGQDDLVIGSPIANRTRPESEGLIGFLANLLALRTDLSGDPTFRELLARVREVALEAYAHQDMPFEMLVEALQPERNMGRTPIFQALFALQTHPAPTLTLPGVAASTLPSARRTSKFDLSLIMRSTGAGLATTLEYSTDLFEAATAGRMLGDFQRLLEAIVRDPGARLSALRFMTESEREHPRDRGEPIAPRNAVPVAREDEPGERPPRTPLEEMLARVWADVLGIERPGVNQDFFDLGGHSLLAAILVSRISTALGRDVPVRLLLLHPSVAALARALEEQQRPGSNGHGPAARGPASDYHLVRIERRPLVTLFTAGELAPVDAAAISYLPDDLPARTGLTPEELVRAWHGGAPTLRAVLETSLGCVASIVLPRFRSELYDDADDLVRLVLEALALAKEAGARAVSLTGLIPSATEYGRRIMAAVAGRQDVPVISTGHATTAATVVLAIERILREAGRSLAQEHVGVLGLGSIGLTSLRLMLRRLPHPRELTLCDVYARRQSLEEIRRRITDELGFRGRVHLLGSRATVPSAFYDTTLVLGATNVAEVLDVTRVAPGTLLVDDSGPHCFGVDEAWHRLRSSGDILFTEGGMLRAPHLMETLRYLPRAVEEAMTPAYLDSFMRRDPLHITGCVLSALLSACFDELPPTIGVADDEACARHHDHLRALGFQAGDLQCQGQRTDADAITRFRQEFGAAALVAEYPG